MHQSSIFIENNNGKYWMNFYKIACYFAKKKKKIEKLSIAIFDWLIASIVIVLRPNSIHQFLV